MQYQLLPSLSPDEYLALKQDIADRGVQVPIELDEHGNILDGNHREMICRELGIKEYPTIVRVGLTEDEKTHHIISLNINRRHLSREQRDELIVKLRGMGWKIETIADETKSSIGTVHNAIKGNELFKNEKLPGKDGKYRPAVYNKDRRSKQRALSALGKMGGLLPDDAPIALDSKQVSKFAFDKQKNDLREAAANAGITGELLIGASVLLGDFREVLTGIPDNSIDMIFTDPPYDEETIPLYGDLAIIAARILKPGGSLLAYAGNYAIPQYLELMTPHLRYWWTLALFHDGDGGNARLNGKNIIVEWKPILWFVKEFRYNNEYVPDRFNTHDQGKEYHDWQQSVEEAEFYISKLTDPGGTIIDPFCGSGTSLIGALKCNRKAIGIEINPVTRNAAIARIQEAGYGNEL